MEFELNQAVLGEFSSQIENLFQNEIFLSQLKEEELLSETEIEQYYLSNEINKRRKLFNKLRTRHNVAEKLLRIFETSPTYPKNDFLSIKEAFLQKLEVNKGLALQIASVPHNIFDVNEPLLYHILGKAENKKIYILSINGRYRGGKSFLLCQALKYLMFGECDQSWLEKELSSPFTYEGSAEAVTQGIQMFSEPFIKDNTAIFLIDCQGLLDPDMTENANAMLFSFSSMISSDFVFNDYGHTEDAFQLLGAYLQFSNVTGNDESSRVKFTFLRRDWDNEHEYSFGLHTSTTEPSGSVGNLKKYLFDPRPEQAYDVHERKKAIEALTRDISVFAMPHPQNRIPDPNIPASEWDPNFRKYVVEFLELKLGSRNVQENVKTIGGKIITGREFSENIKAWCTLLQDQDRFPQMESLLSVTAELQEIGILKMYRELYEERIGSILAANPQGLIVTELNRQQSEIMAGIEAAFASEKLINDDRAGMLNRLRSAVLEIWATKQQINGERFRLTEAQRIAEQQNRMLVSQRAAKYAAAARAVEAARVSEIEQLRQQAKQARIQAAEEEVKSALEHMNLAKSNVDDVIANTAAFHYQETISIKHRPRLLGIKVSPYYTYETVAKFKADAYNCAVQQAQSGYREAEVRYNNALANLQNVIKVVGEVVTAKKLKDHDEAWRPLLQDKSNCPDVESLPTVTPELQEFEVLRKYSQQFEENIQSILESYSQGLATSEFEQQGEKFIRDIETAFKSERMINEDRQGVFRRLQSLINKIWTTKQQVNNDRLRQAAEIAEAQRIAAVEEKRRADAERASQEAEAARAAEAARLAQEEQLREEARQARIQAAEVEAQSANDHLNWAKSHLDGVTKNTTPFYYTEQVPTKHKRSFMGFNSSPYYTYENVQRFNQAAYNGAVQQARSTVQEAEVRHSNALANLQNARGP